MQKGCAMSDKLHYDVRVPYCPYYGREREGKLYCEGVTIKFPDQEAREEIVRDYCSDPGNYQNCMICKMLSSYYDRKYKEG